MKQIRIGIIGCGAVAYRWYLKGLAQPTEEYRLVAVCDVNGQRAEQARRDFAVANAYTDIGKLLRSGIDLAVILTRHSDHKRHITRCLNHGIHVYSEKPFVLTSREGRAVIDLAARRGLVLGSAPQVMLSSRNRTVKRWLTEGKLGKLSYLRVSSSNLGPAGRTDTNYDPEWFYNEGGSLWSLGIYGLSLLVWLMGKPRVVSSFSGISFPEREVMHGPVRGKRFRVTAPDNVTALFEFPQQVFAVYDGSYAVTTPAPYELEIHGERGSLLVNGFGGPGSMLFVPVGGSPVQVGPDDDCHIRWNLSWGVEETVRAIRARRQPEASAHFALQTIEVIEAMSRSAARGKHIHL